MPSLFDIHPPPWPPAKNIWLESWNGMLSRRRLRRRYRSVQMHIQRLPEGPERLGAGVIFCATQSEPDDCAIAHYILRKHFQLDPYFLLDHRQIDAQPALSRLGALGIHYDHRAATVTTLHFAAELLRGTDLPGTLPFEAAHPRGLWTQPVDDERSRKAGVLRCRTAIARLVRFASGLKDDTGRDTTAPPASIGHHRMSARLRRAQMVPLIIPVALHRLHTPAATDGSEGLAREDLYIDFGEPWEISDFNIGIQAWTHLLEEHLNRHHAESTHLIQTDPGRDYQRILT